MPDPTAARRVDDGGVEEIARAYLRAAGGDAIAALRLVVTEALAEIDHAEHRLLERVRLASRGYARGATGAAAG